MTGRAERLAALHQAAFSGVSRGWTGQEITALAARGALIADETDRGFAVISVAADEAELLTIAVAPDARRGGVGASLLAAAEAAALAAGAARMFLEVAADNDAALRLYIRAGYEQTGRRPGYYRRPDGRVDAFLLTKQLS